MNQKPMTLTLSDQIKNIFRLKSLLSLSMIFLVGISGDLFALGSGALGNETGNSSKVVSHGGAFAGVADDPSAAFYNPAGLTQVKGFHVQMGGAFLDMNSEHTTPAGVTDEMVSNTVFAPNFFATYSGADSRWAFGLGVNSPFGLITEWKNDSFSRFYATESKLLMYNVSPVVSYAVSDKLSVGGGINYFNVFDTELNQQILNVDGGFMTPTGTFGDSKLSGDGTGWGYNVALHWKPTNVHSFGLTYRSQVNVPIEGELEITGLEQGTATLFGGSSYRSDVTTEFKFPQSVLLGYGFRPSDRWTIFADYEWVNWSVVDHTRFSYANDNALLTHEVERDWKSTSNIGLGAEWDATERMVLRFGALAYERVVPSGTLESSLPDSSRVAFSFGPGFQFGNTSIDLGYMGIFFKKRDIQNDAGNALADMDGEYETQVNVFNFGIKQKFGGATN